MNSMKGIVPLACEWERAVGFVNVCQCAKSLKCLVFQAFSHSFDVNVYKNAKK